MKKGISLIVLVISIIIMIILAAVIVISLANNGIIFNAEEATFKQNIKTFILDYEQYVGFYEEKNGTRDTLNVAGENIHTVITSIPSNLEYKEKLAIKNGNFVYVLNVKDKDDVKRATWACEVGMVVEGINKCSDIQYIETHKTAYEKKGTIYYNTPDITGLNPEKTYFVTYKEDGTEVIGTNIGSKAPEDWFDYENKKWANIVAINGDAVAYLVWIPRYAYKVDSAGKVVDVRFVTVDNVYTAPDGTKITYNDTAPTFDENGNQTNYVVSSAFTVDMTDDGGSVMQLAGFWMTKYELYGADITKVETDTKGTEIIVYRCTTTGSIGNKKFEYYLDNKLITTNTTGTYTFEGLTPNTEYKLKIVLKDGEVVMDTYEETITTCGVAKYNEPNEPELTGLNLDKTYYLTYDEAGEEIRTPVMKDGQKQAAPTNWYNYSAKEWANIVVVNEDIGSEVYLVWVPRYEYRVMDGSSTASEKYVDISFIGKDVTEPTPGYIISSAFTVDMTDDGGGILQLPGFWMTKYELYEVAQ